MGHIRRSVSNGGAQRDLPCDLPAIFKARTAAAAKANCTRYHECEQILFDDSDKVRNGWSLGATVNPTTTNIIDYLKALL